MIPRRPSKCSPVLSAPRAPELTEVIEEGDIRGQITRFVDAEGNVEEVHQESNSKLSTLSSVTALDHSVARRDERPHETHG